MIFAYTFVYYTTLLHYVFTYIYICYMIDVYIWYAYIFMYMLSFYTHISTYMICIYITYLSIYIYDYIYIYIYVCYHHLYIICIPCSPASAQKTGPRSKSLTSIRFSLCLKLGTLWTLAHFGWGTDVTPWRISIWKKKCFGIRIIWCSVSFQGGKPTSEVENSSP